MSFRASFLAALVALGASPASALIIGMNPDPASVPDLAGEQFQVEFVGATEGTVPTGGFVLAGSVGAGDEVIVLRFTTLGPATLTSFGSFPAGTYDYTAIGHIPGSATIEAAQISDPNGIPGIATDGVPTGSHIDVFFAISGLEDGELISPFAYTNFAQSVEVALAVPEPVVVLLLAAGGLTGRIVRRPLRAFE